MVTSGSLFDASVPDGFQYRDDFISPDEEVSLVNQIRRIEFSAFETRGVVARRRVAWFGRSYDRRERPTSAMPDFLLAVRDRAAAWIGIERDAFAMALITEYQPGAPIGWHRDAPLYDIVSGISLLSTCRMKFRPYISPPARTSAGGPPRKTTHEIVLAARSAYVMAGKSRQAFEHSIPAVTSLRYSVTFRTLRS